MIAPDGGRVKVQFAAFVLAHSRYKYAEFQSRPFTAADLTRACHRCFHFIGGIPEELVFDQEMCIRDRGWLYLCTVKDIVSGEILGEATGERMKKELVIQAFLNAQARHKLKPGTIFHSDRGCQYTSKEFMDTLKLYGIKQSFSRVGMPGDNSWSESFFATLKKECIHFRQFTTRDELRQMVFSWIESFYNNRRVQARLGYMSPREYASWLMSEKQAA